MYEQPLFRVLYKCKSEQLSSKTFTNTYLSIIAKNKNKQQQTTTINEKQQNIKLKVNKN